MTNRYPGASLDFMHDCRVCGRALIYPSAEELSLHADGTERGLCMWCNSRTARPYVWRFTSDQWQLYRIRQASNYPTLPLEIRRPVAG